MPLGHPKIINFQSSRLSQLKKLKTASIIFLITFFLLFLLFLITFLKLVFLFFKLHHHSSNFASPYNVNKFCKVSIILHNTTLMRDQVLIRSQVSGKLFIPFLKDIKVPIFNVCPFLCLDMNTNLP